MQLGLHSLQRTICSRCSPLLTSFYPTKHRRVFRLINSQTRSTTPRRSQTAAFLTKLAKNHNQSLGSANGEGIQARIALPPTSQPLSSNQTCQPRKVRGASRGGIQTPAEGSSQCSEEGAGPIPVLSPQIRWVLAASNQSQGDKHTVT